MSTDAIVLLKEDHKEIKKAFDAFENAGENAHAEKGRLVKRMIELLTVHTYIENEVMYPRVRQLLPDLEDDVLESYEEHHVADVLVMELVGMKPDAERFDAKTTVLIENVRHHIDEEEQEWFPKVRDGLGRNVLQEIGAEMAKAKKTAPKSPAQPSALKKTIDAVISYVPLSSVWQDRHPRTDSAGPAEVDGRYDVTVIGAGLTGLTTALLLGRAGQSVLVLEAGRVGAGTTARSTAKFSLLQGTQLSTIRSRHPQAVVNAYVEAQREGAAWVRRFCADHDVALQDRDAVTYANTGSGRRSLQDEQDAAERAGLSVEWVEELPLPYSVRGALRMPGQFQLDPVELLDALSRQAVAHGVRVVERTRVLKVRGSDPVRITTENGQAEADRVVVATNLPILDRGGFFARMKPARSYSVAFRTEQPVVDAMYLSADEPSRSLRDAPVDSGHLLLVGGNGHTTGRGGSTRQRLDALRAWTREYWPDAEETHAWSAQDYVPHHALPFAGPILPGTDEILVGGGYSKWGMTNAVAVSLALTARILGTPPDWAGVLGTYAPTELRGLPTAARDNAEVGLEMTRGWVGALAGRSLRRDGLTRVCTHLGGVVRWNDAERSWDCPLHGSRFDENRSVLDGPAVRALPGR